jgi:hypothetical protein
MVFGTNLGDSHFLGGVASGGELVSVLPICFGSPGIGAGLGTSVGQV